MQLEEASGNHKTWKTIFTSFVHPRFHFFFPPPLNSSFQNIAVIFLWGQTARTHFYNQWPLSLQQAIHRVALDKMHKVEDFIIKKEKMKNNWINIDHDFSTAFLIITARQSLPWAVKLSHVLLALHRKLWKDTNLFCQRTEEHLVITESMVVIHCRVKGEENRTITQSLERVIPPQLIPERRGRARSQRSLTPARVVFISSSTATWQLCPGWVQTPRLLLPEAFVGMPQVVTQPAWKPAPWQRCPPEVGTPRLAVLLLVARPRAQTRPFRKVVQYIERYLSVWITKLEPICWNEGVQSRIGVKSLSLSGLSNLWQELGIWSKSAAI